VIHFVAQMAVRDLHTMRPAAASVAMAEIPANPG
jgi:hypothetical protein